MSPQGENAPQQPLAGVVDALNDPLLQRLDFGTQPLCLVGTIGPADEPSLRECQVVEEFAEAGRLAVVSSLVGFWADNTLAIYSP